MIKKLSRSLSGLTVDNHTLLYLYGVISVSCHGCQVVYYNDTHILFFWLNEKENIRKPSPSEYHMFLRKIIYLLCQKDRILLSVSHDRDSIITLDFCTHLTMFIIHRFERENIFTFMQHGYIKIAMKMVFVCMEFFIRLENLSTSNYIETSPWKQIRKENDAVQCVQVIKTKNAKILKLPSPCWV